MASLNTIYHLNNGASASTYTNANGVTYSVFESNNQNIEIPIQQIETASDKLLETIISLNQGRLILPGKYRTLLLEKLKKSEAQIMYEGYTYKFLNNKGNKFAAIRLDGDVVGEFRVGLQDDAFFIPSGLKMKTPLNITFISRAHSLNQEMVVIEDKLLKNHPYINIEDFNFVGAKDFTKVMSEEMSSEEYLARFSKKSGIVAKPSELAIHIYRLELLKNLYRDGKTIARPIFARKRHFTKAETTFIDMAIKEAYAGGDAFKKTPTGKYTFEEFLFEGENYLYSCLALTKLRIREINKAITNIIVNNETRANSERDIFIAFLTSTVCDAINKEVDHLWEDFPVKANTIVVEHFALSNVYQCATEDFPKSPLYEIKARMLHEDFPRLFIKLKVAQESAYQILKKTNSRLITTIQKSKYPAIEKNYQAACLANKMSLTECENLYNAFRRGLY